jgi:hypothetical protein
MMMTNGLGSIIGAVASGIIINRYFILENGDKDWQGIWQTFALYALAVAVLFAILFRHKHDPASLGTKNIGH